MLKLHYHWTVPLATVLHQRRELFHVGMAVQAQATRMQTRGGRYGGVAQHHHGAATVDHMVIETEHFLGQRTVRGGQVDAHRREVHAVFQRNALTDHQWAL